MALPRYEDEIHREERREERHMESEVARLEHETRAFERAVAIWSDVIYQDDEARREERHVLTNRDLLRSIGVSLEVCERMLARAVSGSPESEMLQNVRTNLVAAVNAMNPDEPIARTTRK